MAEKEREEAERRAQAAEFMSAGSAQVPRPTSATAPVPAPAVLPKASPVILPTASTTSVPEATPTPAGAPEVFAPPSGSATLPMDPTASLGMSISSAVSVPEQTSARRSPSGLSQKPWLRCGIPAWEEFLLERNDSKLCRAATVRHAHAEWLQVYNTCMDEGHREDAKSLLRLIYAQTRQINISNDFLLLARVCGLEVHTCAIDDITAPLDQWRRNQDPFAPPPETFANFTPRLVLGCITVLEGDSLSAVADLRNVEHLENATIALICPCTDHPGSRVMYGGSSAEEELYRRSDIQRHMETYLQGNWPYPFRTHTLGVGKAAVVQGVSCYRDDKQFGYKVKNEAVMLTVILSAPQRNPITTGRTYALADERNTCTAC